MGNINVHEVDKSLHQSAAPLYLIMSKLKLWKPERRNAERN